MTDNNRHTMLIKGPGDMERQLSCFYWYDGPMLFTFPHEGAERLFVCCETTESSTIYYGASPSPELFEKICDDEEKMICGFEEGPFFRMIWDHTTPYPRDVTQIEAFPPDMLPGKDVYLNLETDLNGPRV